MYRTCYVKHYYFQLPTYLATIKNHEHVGMMLVKPLQKSKENTDWVKNRGKALCMTRWWISN